jgi:microcystin-dependent protein
MSQPYVGEIRLVGFNFAPEGWFLCQGQTLPISQYEVLFNLIGTTYGGDGQTTFQLPNLASRTPVHMGGSNSYIQGQTGGVESVLLTAGQLPAHSHPIIVQGTAGNVPSPIGGIFADSTAGQYAPTASAASGPILSSTGGGQSHNNLQPLVCLNYIIAYAGIYPSQN